MKEKNNYLVCIFITLSLTAIAVDPVFARDLNDVAKNAFSEMREFGFSAMGIGGLVAGIAFCFCLARLGYSVLQNWIVGIVLVLTTPMLVSLFHKISR